jgi:Protein of unknown function (DUF3347)
MKNIIEILGIVLPALIIILGFIRIFVQKTKGVNGLTMLFAILLLIIGFIQYFIFQDSRSGNSDDKLPPLSVSKHSNIFNQSLENVLNAYYKLTDGFVKNDVPAINQSGNELKTALDSFKLEELMVDSLIYETALQPYGNTRAEIASIIADPSMSEKRASLNIFSNELYSLLRTVRYDLAKLYWRECPDAFGEGNPGSWLSKSEEKLNPYGKEDCAETRSTVNFVPADSTTKKEPTKQQ